MARKHRAVEAEPGQGTRPGWGEHPLAARRGPAGRRAKGQLAPRRAKAQHADVNTPSPVTALWRHTVYLGVPHKETNLTTPGTKVEVAELVSAPGCVLEARRLSQAWPSIFPMACATGTTDEERATAHDRLHGSLRKTR